MPEAGTHRSLAHAGSGGSDWRGMGPADPETTTCVQWMAPAAAPFVPLVGAPSSHSKSSANSPTGIASRTACRKTPC